MIDRNIETIIIKYITNQANISELEVLEQWISQPGNEVVFNDYVKLNFAVEHSYRTFDVAAAKKKVLYKLENDKKVFRMRPYLKMIPYAAAAIIIGFLVSIYIFKDSLLDKQTIEPTIVNNIQIGSDKATLTLEDGSTVRLEKGAAFSTDAADSNGEQIIYNPTAEQSNEVAFNYLTIPRGGQFFVQLSDGSKVWLNSESKLKYPVNFVDGKPRSVELVYGEAYFEVSPSSKHGGSRFYVHSSEQTIEVLGTEFNVKAYEDESMTYTTLVEGKITLATQGHKKVLQPNQQAVVAKDNNSIEIKAVEVYAEISWKDGIFIFKQKTLKELMKVISRWYDVEVVFENKALESVTFKGVLGKDQSIEEILTAIKASSVINSYEIKNNVITIK